MLNTACFHCGLPCLEGTTRFVEIDGKQQPMCCPGCEAVAKAIVDNGLVDFYRLRSENSQNPAELVPAALREADIFDRDSVQQSFVRRQGDDIREASLILEGIVCAACVWLSERHVTALPGVISFRVNYSTHRAQVKWDNSQIQLSSILRAIAAIGYLAHPFDPGRQEALQRKERKQALWRIAIAGFGAMQVMMLAVAMYSGDYHGMDDNLRRFMRWVSLIITTPVVFYSARPFFTAAWRGLRRFQLNMDVPVSLAIAAAFSASTWNTLMGGAEVYFDSVTMFTFFLLTGRYLEMSARHRAGQAAEELVRLLPAVATRLQGDQQTTVPVAELQVGDRILVRPGETIAADGVIEEGTSSIDESLLTGESFPVRRSAGQAVTGGTVNAESPLIVVVEKVGEDTVLASIVHLLERAQTEKPRLALLADRVAAWFVGAILLIATLVAAWWYQHSPEAAFTITLSVLVVTCPCALSLATPAAITAATGSLTRMGLLVTRGHALETFAQVTHMVFDKTGTLSLGRLRLDRISLLRADVTEERVLAMAAMLEQASEHPVGKLLASGMSERSADDLVNYPGQGVEGHIDGKLYRIGNEAFVAWQGADLPMLEAGPETRVWLVDGHGPLACFHIVDALREEAAEVIASLKALKVQPVILSGDSPDAVADVAARLGIENARARLKPGDKLDFVRDLQARGAVVAMIGDGVNDAPVLAGANVSVAMGSGTQLAHASADMVLLSNDLSRLPYGVLRARKTVGVIRQNLGWALFYNLMALPLAAAGWVAPWMAALGMSFSSLVVVLNALRLSGQKVDKKRLQPARRSPAKSEA